jgi:hypothetical protein
MLGSRSGSDNKRESIIGCPSCGFFVTEKEICEIEKMFAPAMDAAVAIFEAWRKERAVRE